MSASKIGVEEWLSVDWDITYVECEDLCKRNGMTIWVRS